MYKEELKKAFTNNDYKLYLELLYDYLSEGYGVDLEIALEYITISSKNKYYTDAYNKALMLIDDAQKYHFETSLAIRFYYLYQLEIAKKLILSKSSITIGDYFFLGKIYLLSGDIKKAKYSFEHYLEKADKKKYIEKTNMYLRKIINHEEFNSFIETEYHSFLEKGNILEPGNIIFVKNNIDNPKNEDNSFTRFLVYMIWKIDGDTLYLFPVSKKTQYSNYIIKKENYPNSFFDRVVKEDLYITTVDNVLSVVDKLREIDYLGSIANIFYSLCKKPKHNIYEQQFMEEYLDNISINSIVVTMIDNIKHYYFVTKIEDNNFIGYEIDIKGFYLLSNTPSNISKDLIINYFSISEDDSLFIKDQLPFERNLLK